MIYPDFAKATPGAADGPHAGPPRIDSVRIVG